MALKVFAWREGDEVLVSAPYEYLEQMRSLRARTWDTERKVWRTPLALDIYQDLLRLFAGDLEMHYDLAMYFKELTLAQDDAQQLKVSGQGGAGSGVAGLVKVEPWSDNEAGQGFLTEPWAHQRAAVEIMANPTLQGYALFWEMGTGKTKAAIDICRQRKCEQVLIICPNEVKYNWRREIRIHGQEDTLILEGPLRERSEILRAGPIPRYTVVNVESVAPLYQDFAARSWDAIVVDEATRIKNPSAQRTKAVLALTARTRLILTGTPVTQHLYDLYAPLSFIQPGVFGRYGYFRWRYFEQVWEPDRITVTAQRMIDQYDPLAKGEMHFGKQSVISGRDVLRPRRDTLPELLRIVDSLSYRVTKSEVLPELPEKLPPQTLEVELREAQRDAYAQMKHAFRVWLDKLPGAPQTQAALILTQKLRLAEITSGFIRNDETGEVTWLPQHAKSEVLDRLLDDLLPSKVVIFCHWRPECEHYFKRYESYGSGLIYGGMQPKDRDAIVNAFQNSETPRVLVCQEGSGGVGINLTAASTAIYTSRSWSLEQWLQSQDRLHRAGQKNPVTLVVIQARRSVDEEVAEVLEGKASIAEIVTRDQERVPTLRSEAGQESAQSAGSQEEHPGGA